MATRRAPNWRRAELYWLSTVRPDGRPHVTPLIAAWMDGALHICTGPQERKARNLAENPHCVVTTGCNALHEGLDVVIEGDAVRVERQHRSCNASRTRTRPSTGASGTSTCETARSITRPIRRPSSNASAAFVFAVAPTTAFGFGKGPYSQTRWTF